MGSDWTITLNAINVICSPVPPASPTRSFTFCTFSNSSSLEGDETRKTGGACNRYNNQVESGKGKGLTGDNKRQAHRSTVAVNRANGHQTGRRDMSCSRNCSILQDGCRQSHITLPPPMRDPSLAWACGDVCSRVYVFCVCIHMYISWSTVPCSLTLLNTPSDGEAFGYFGFHVGISSHVPGMLCTISPRNHHYVIGCWAPQSRHPVAVYTPNSDTKSITKHAYVYSHTR